MKIGGIKNIFYLGRLRRVLCIALIAAPLFIFGCTAANIDDIFSGGVGGENDPTQLQMASGNLQKASPGALFETPLRVQLSHNDSPLKEQTVFFSVSSGTGILSADSVVTDQLGVAQITVIAGDNPGPLEVVASVFGRSVTFNLTINEHEPKISIASGNFQTGEINSQLPLPIKVQARIGSVPIPNVVIDFNLQSGSGTLSSSSALTDSTGYGEVHFTTGSTIGPAVVTASGLGKTIDFSLNESCLASGTPSRHGPCPPQSVSEREAFKMLVGIASASG